MAIASKLSKKTTIRKQTGLGNVGSGTGQVLRRTSSTFSANRDMYQSAEVVSHHQSEGNSYGLKRTQGSVEGEISAGTYQLLIEGMLEASAAAVSAYNVGSDVVPNEAGTFTTTAGDYLAAGLKVGMVGRWTGFASPGDANNATNFLITALTDKIMTGVFLNGDSVTTDTAGDDVTFTVVGQVVSPPLTGHTKDYFQVEEWYSDLTDSDLFSDCLISGIELNLPASGNGTISTSFVGLTRLLSGEQVMTSPTAESETDIMSSINGYLYVNGTLTPVSSIQVSISNAAATTGAEIGSNSPSDINRNVISVSGSFTQYVRDQVLSTLYDAETEVSLIAVMAADETATSDFVAITLGKIKITGDAPDDNDSIMRTFPFTARINHDGGTALAWPETIISIQDSQFA